MRASRVSTRIVPTSKCPDNNRPERGPKQDKSVGCSVLIRPETSPHDLGIGDTRSQISDFGLKTRFWSLERRFPAVERPAAALEWAVFALEWMSHSKEWAVRSLE